MAPCEVSVIVPTLNEAEALPELLRDLQTQTGVRFEVLVADGGSDDGTTTVAGTFACARVVICARGRGRQMNRAAREARGRYLFFVHADSRLVADDLLMSARDALDAARQTAGHDRVAGHFRLEFIRHDRQAHPVAFRYAEEKMAFDRPHVVNGDQGLFLAGSFFADLGGFDESLDFFEDQRIAADIRRNGCWVLLPGKMLTSARRFEAAGFHRLYILMSIMMALYWTGATRFFERAPGIYRQQRDMGRLLLTPFFRDICVVFREDYGVRGTLRLLVGIGRFVRSHSWQMFYFVDIWLRPLLGPKKYPFLRFHDVVFRPATNFLVFDILAAVSTVFWFLAVLYPFYTVVDRRHLAALARDRSMPSTRR